MRTEMDHQRLSTSPRATSWSHGLWGGFLLTQRGERKMHAKLTGRLSERTLVELERHFRVALVPGQTHFLVLDAANLEHIPLLVAHSLVEREAQWRRIGVVALWVGLNRYLANLLVLAGGCEAGPPALDDLDAAWSVLDELTDWPAPVARGRLEMYSTFVH